MMFCLIIGLPDIQAQETYDKPNIQPCGTFRFIINPLEEPITPYDGFVEIKGEHQMIPGKIELIFPGLLFWQYTVIEVKEKPEWATVILPEAILMTKPDGVEYNFSIFIAVNQYAPWNAYGIISFEISTGRFIRTFFPPWFPFCNEFNMEQMISVTTGIW